MKNINPNLKVPAIAILAAVLAMCLWGGISLIGRKICITLFGNNIIMLSGMESCILIGQYFVIKKYNKGNFSFDFIDLNFKENSIKQLFIGISIGTLMYIIWVFILSAINIIEFKGIGFLFYPANKVIAAIMSAFVLSFFASLTEEVLVRGIILKHLMKLKGKVFALIISSLIFAMFHTRYYQRPYALICVFTTAILLGYLYIVTESLYLSIGLHFAMDFYPIMTGDSNNLLIFHVKNNKVDLGMYFGYVQIFVDLILILALVLYRYKTKNRGVNIEV